MKLEVSLYPFCGHPFTSLYEYANLTVSRCYFSSKSEYTISLNIKNIGDHEGIEVAQLVFHELLNHNMNIKRLPGFSKISLMPGQSKNVKFVFSPDEHINQPFSGNRVLEVVAGRLKRKFSFQC